MGSNRDAIAGKAVRLADCVAYGDGAVVSRTVLDHQEGTLTLFAFDVGEGLSEHTSPYDAFVQVLEGEAEITIGGRPMRVIEGESVLMPAGVPHALRAAARFKMLLTLIRAKVGG